MFIIYGHMLDIYSIQIVYYMICMIALVLAIVYTTASVIVFFKDLGQIINIFMQVGMWMTPIMWSHNMIDDKYRWILKLNPMYYIVEGYRDSLINKVWFWERYIQTTYFWIVVSGLFFVSVIIFKKLKIHFADVL